MGAASDPWRRRAESTLISSDELDQIVSNAEATPEADKLLASVVPEAALREILKHIDDETTNFRNRSQTNPDRKPGDKETLTTPRPRYVSN